MFEFEIQTKNSRKFHVEIRTKIRKLEKKLHKRLMSNSEVLLVIQYPSTIKNADQIVVKARVRAVFLQFKYYVFIILVIYRHLGF